MRSARSHSDERTSFVTAGAGSLPTRPGGFGSVTSSLVLNFFPEPLSAVEEMHGLAVSGGTVSACVWDYAGRMDFLRRLWDVASSMDPKARELDEAKRFPICRPEVLDELSSMNCFATLGFVTSAAIRSRSLRSSLASTNIGSLSSAAQVLRPHMSPRSTRGTAQPSQASWTEPCRDGPMDASLSSHAPGQCVDSRAERPRCITSPSGGAHAMASERSN
jgi:hypothetical protein